MASFQYIDKISYNPFVTTYDGGTNRWTKGGSTNAYDDAVFSAYCIVTPQTDQSVRGKLIEVNKKRAFGFSSRARNRPDLAGDYMMEIDVDGTIRVIESGTIVATYGTTASVDDELRVQIIFETGAYRVKYWWRDDENSAEQLVHTSAQSGATVSNKFPLHCKAEFFSVGATVRNLSIEENGVGTNIVQSGDIEMPEPDLVDSSHTIEVDILTLSNIDGEVSSGCNRPEFGQLFPLGDKQGL